MPPRNDKARKLIADAIASGPSMATRTMAKMLFAKHPRIWLTYDACRSAVRKARGSHGALNRKWTKPIQVRTSEESAACERWGALLPEPIVNKWAWQSLPGGVTQWLVLSDIHVPYHDPIALRVALEYGRGCDGVLLLGDSIDCYALSRFEKDPEARDYANEVGDLCRLLDALTAWGAKRIVFKLGNHEARLERYLLARCPELWHGKLREKIGWRAFCDLDQRGVMLVDSMDPIKVGKLTLLHGHEFGGGFSSPVNPARGVYLKGKECAIIGHEHRTSEHTEQSMTGTTVTTWSVGCLCDLNPQYRPFNKWNTGFGVLDTANGEWSFQNYRIVDGKVK